MADGDQGRGFFPGAIDPDISEKTVLPRTANTEAVLALKPDVVVMKNFLEKRMGEPLERVGIETVYLDLETPEAWMEDLLVLGDLFDNQERAEELREMFQSRITAVQTPLRNLDEGRKPKTLVLYRSVKDGVKAVNVPPLTWIQTRMVEMAGGIPVWSDADFGKRWTRTGIEQIAAWDPDVIFVAAYHVNAVDAVEELTQDPAWASLRAVRNGNIHPFPADYHSWDQPDVRWLLGLQWMAVTLHPDLFGDVDMEREARVFFKDMFFMDDTSFDKNIKPRLTGLNPVD
jgi:iron complex transport system substrate-binding protein